MRIQLTVPHELVSAATLGAALEASTRLGTVERKRGLAPPVTQAIKEGLRWRREPPGLESFDPPSVAYPRRWGDCDDLAPWRAADLRVSGEDRGAKAIAVPSGPQRWHAIVQRSDGTREDPSLWAGMPGVVGQSAPLARAVRGAGRGAVIIGEGAVRIDVPGLHARQGCPMGYAVIAQNPSRDAAIREALAGAVRVGRISGIAEPRALAFLRALYRFVCQSQDIREALAIEGLPASLASSPLALALRREHEVGFACLAAIPAIAAGVAAAVGAVTPIVKAVVDAINATAKAVEQGVKPISELYQQVRSGIDQGTVNVEVANKTADELAAQGFGAEAVTLRQQAAEAEDARRRRIYATLQGDQVAVMSEALMKAARGQLDGATRAAAAGDVDGANRVRDETRRTVLGSLWLPEPGPAAVWASLARAYGLDPETGRAPLLPAAPGAKAARIHRGPQASPIAPGPAPQTPAGEEPFLTPGIDALFARAGAFM